MQPRNIALLFPLALALGACAYGNDSGSGSGVAGGAPSATLPPVPESAVDTGVPMGDVTPGEGAGTFIEYQAGGHWHLFTSCDTKLPKSQGPCSWDIIVSAATSDTIQSFQPDRLENDDRLGWGDGGSVHLVADNSYDFDGFYFDAVPGAVVRFDVYLDGQPGPRYIYWNGNGGLHSGAPSNPIDLTPSTP